mmetsp:Transcript_11901/g.14162  ORF Transcript_11901/g.14162 Transcript_11901/m.14162 type:complete len:203 (-) Transcript_11901:404-1012(-)
MFNKSFNTLFCTLAPIQRNISCPFSNRYIPVASNFSLDGGMIGGILDPAMIRGFPSSIKVWQPNIRGYIIGTTDAVPIHRNLYRNADLASTFISDRNAGLFCIARVYNGSNFNTSGRINCPLDDDVAQNFLYEYSAETQWFSAFSRACARDMVPAMSAFALCAISTWTWTSRSAARKRFPRMVVLGRVRLWTRILLSPVMVV